MGFFSTTGKLLVGTAKLTGKLGVGTVKVTGKALNGTAKFVANHQEQISSATKAVVGVSGMLVKETGSAVAAGAGAVARGLHKAGSQSEGNCRQGTWTCGWLCSLMLSVSSER
jgi:hypothetical protein